MKSGPEAQCGNMIFLKNFARNLIFDFLIFTESGITQSGNFVRNLIWSDTLFCFIFADSAQKMKFFVKDFFTKCDQIRRKMRISSHLLKKSLMKIFIFCAMWQKGDLSNRKCTIIIKIRDLCSKIFAF